ncbi:MAG: high frequency lysogenization protein HflD [Pseudomonadales bacterium]
MNFEKRVLPLAGMVQAVHLVVSAAKNGMVAQDSLDKTLAPIFVQNPDSMADVYAGTKNISLGLNLLQEMLTNFRSEAHGDVVRYTMAVIGLERSLAAQPEKLQALGDAIAQITPAQSDDAEMPVKALADVYEQIISTIEPRIKISGNRGHLQNISNVQRIRALLLAALRSAVLWRQVGGRRWQLLLQRGKYRNALENYI